MQVIAHRGANSEELENSFSAFDLALKVGATKFEFDVQETKDHHAVVMHDKSLLRTTGVLAKVADLTRAEINKISLFNGEAIPFLDEMLEKYLPRNTNLELNIEIKNSSISLTQTVAKLIKNHSERERIICSSFKWQPLQELMQSAPEIKRACIWGKDLLPGLLKMIDTVFTSIALAFLLP